MGHRAGRRFDNPYFLPACTGVPDFVVPPLSALVTLDTAEWSWSPRDFGAPGSRPADAVPFALTCPGAAVLPSLVTLLTVMFFSGLFPAAV